MQPSKTLEKYLANYAEPCSRAIPSSFIAGCKTYQHCVVLPCFNENTAFIRRLQSRPFKQSGTLAIIVLNQPAGRNHITRLNARIIQHLNESHLKKLYSASEHYEPFTLFTATNPQLADILLINCCEPGLPPKQGVGLARKIGADIATQLFAQGKITSQWLHSTDADATLPEDYFELPNINAVAATYSFMHQFLKAQKSATEMTLEKASFFYEQRLHYYQQGLEFAGSPYAFHTVGSALAFTFEAYCQVRGFPRRAAGEDFYLLNKIAKLGPVISLPQQITLQPRASMRVPFGTGPATRELLTNTKRVDYNPEIFVELKQCLLQLPNTCEQLIDTKKIDYGRLGSHTIMALNAIGIESLWQHIAKQKMSYAQAAQAAAQWLDGFRTLKFIHQLSDQHLPKLPVEQIALSPYPFVKPYTEIWPDH